jgi:hypothetical protein
MLFLRLASFTCNQKASTLRAAITLQTATNPPLLQEHISILAMAHFHAFCQLRLTRRFCSRIWNQGQAAVLPLVWTPEIFGD